MNCRAAQGPVAFIISFLCSVAYIAEWQAIDTHVSLSNKTSTTLMVNMMPVDYQTLPKPATVFIPSEAENYHYTDIKEHENITVGVKLSQTRPVWTLQALNSAGGAVAYGGDQLFLVFRRGDGVYPSFLKQRGPKQYTLDFVDISWMERIVSSDYSVYNREETGVDVPPRCNKKAGCGGRISLSIADSSSSTGTSMYRISNLSANVSATPPIRVFPFPRRVSSSCRKILIFPGEGGIQFSTDILSVNETVASLVQNLQEEVGRVRQVTGNGNLTVLFSAQSLPHMQIADSKEYARFCRLLITCTRLLFPDLGYMWLGSAPLPCDTSTGQVHQQSLLESRNRYLAEKHLMKSVSLPFISWFRVGYLLRAFQTSSARLCDGGRVENGLLRRIVDLYLPDAEFV